MRRLISGGERIVGILLLAILFGSLSCTQPVPTAPVQPAAKTADQPTQAVAKPSEVSLLKVGHMAVPSDGAKFIAFEKGYFEEEGLKVELVQFASGAQMIPALATGQIGIGKGALSAGLFNAITRDLPLKIVAEDARVNADPINQSLALVLRRDLADSGDLKDYSDLKGRNIAILAKGTGNEMNLEDALKRGNLSLSDVSVGEMPFPEMVTGMSNKAIDVALMTEPFITLSKERGIGVLWKPVIEFSPGHQTAVLLYSPVFIKDRPEAAKQFMVAYLRGLRGYYDAFYNDKNKSEIIGILTKHTATKDPAMYEKMANFGLDPNGYVNVKSIMEAQEWFVAKGYSNKMVDEKDLIDYQFLEYALQRLGKY